MTGSEPLRDTSGLLLETLRAETGRPDLELDGAPTPLTGGFGAELLRFRILDPPPNLSGDLVARIIAPRRSAAGRPLSSAASPSRGSPLRRCA